MICPNCKKHPAKDNHYCKECEPKKANPSKFGQKKLKVGLVTLLISIISICGLLFSINLFNTKTNPIEFIQTGMIDLYDSNTIGKSFDNYFNSSNWQSFETDTSEVIVEFIGERIENNQTSKHLIQFTVYPEKETFEITYYEFNGESQNYKSLINLLNDVYSK